MTERSIDGKCLLTLEAGENGTTSQRILDATDAAIVTKRLALFNSRQGPRVGDYVVFADGVERRISHHWKDDQGWDGGVQTSDIDGGIWCGRFYFGNGYLDYSGGLHGCVPIETLTDTGERRDGSAWIFHHDHRRAHNGVDFAIELRVFASSVEAPR